MKKILLCTCALILALFLMACEEDGGAHADPDMDAISGSDGSALPLSGAENTTAPTAPVNDTPASAAHTPAPTAPANNTPTSAAHTPAPTAPANNTPTSAAHTPAPTAPANRAPTSAAHTPAPTVPAENPFSPPSRSDSALTAAELAQYQNFIRRVDVYGFLLSSYSTPLDADYTQVFYVGAGMAMDASRNKINAYLQDMGFEEQYTDITFVSRNNMDSLIQRRTGYRLNDVLARGNLLSEYLDRDGDFALMHGDTNQIMLEAVSGTRISANTVLLESREAGWENGAEESYNGLSCFTTFRETDGEPLIVANAIESGSGELQAAFTTLETPSFDGHRFIGGAAAADPLPATLEVSAMRRNNVSSVADWIAENRAKWNRDPAFSGFGDEEELWRLDRNGHYYFEIYSGQYLDIYERGDGWDMGSWLLCDTLDFTNYLYPNGRSVFEPGDVLEGLDAQEPRWAMLDRGELIVSNFHQTYAQTSGGQNAYLTCVDLDSGLPIWRTDPLVCNSDNFLLVGAETDGGIAEGILLCGYGFTNEDDYIYQISRETGRVLARTPVASKPDRLAYANGVLYVHCYDRDYEFAIAFG